METSCAWGRRGTPGDRKGLKTCGGEGQGCSLFPSAASGVGRFLGSLGHVGTSRTLSLSSNFFHVR